MSKWFLLPGMGATNKMYDSLRSELTFEANFIDWPEYQGESTFSDIAQRIIDENGITPNDIIGGSSLGGMISLEMSQLLDNKKVVLIGSAVAPKEVQAILSTLSPLAALSPITLIQFLAGKQENLISRMFSESDPDFIRAMCSYLKMWPGYNDPKEGVHRIHGRKDYVIPCPKNGVHIVEDGGHLIAMTHPKDVGRFLNRINN